MTQKRTNDGARRLRHTLSVLALAGLAASGVRAEDIDIYQGNAVGGTPNLLIILDNAAAANANTTFTCSALTVSDPGTNFGFEQCGLYGAVQGLSQNATLKGNLNLGLMYFPPSGTKGPNGGTNGATFVIPAATNPGPSSLTLMDSNGIPGMLSRIKQLNLHADATSNNQIAQAMQEAWVFYQGSAKTGQLGLSGTSYPGVTQTGCNSNFVLYITLATSNQKPQDTAPGGKSGDTGQGRLAIAEGDSGAPPTVTTSSSPKWPSGWVSPIGVPQGNKTVFNKAGDKYQGDYSDEWSRFMYSGKVNGQATTYPSISTYTIILTDATNPDYEQLMVTMARQGGTDPMLVKLGDTKALEEAITKVFNKVQAVNSVFSSPVLPVSANTQGTYINQVYMGMFRPDSTGNPRWTGNLKQYQFGVNTTDVKTPQLFLGDASWPPYSAGDNAGRALNDAGTGFLDPGALSFWTSKDTATSPDSLGGFWGTLFNKEGGDAFDAVDGQFVEKGGVSQQIRLAYLTDTYPPATTPTTARNVYGCASDGCTNGSYLSSTLFKASNDATLGLSGKTNLIAWIRGEDTARVANDTTAGVEASTPPTDAKTPITVRGSVHGDVLHSRPVVIDYGGTTGVVVFYGANDGMFRAINGNQPPKNTTDNTKPMGNCKVTTTCAIQVTDATGVTRQVPPGGELWSFVAPEPDFYAGLQKLHDNTAKLTLGATTGSGKPYFFDGVPGVYYNRSTGKAYIYLSARRGGRLLYALDVSDPARPKFMWKRSNTDFAELGQTWSQPKVARVKGYTNPVLIFGAGYDTNEDTEPPTADTMGRGIFILDAVTGDRVWSAQFGAGAASANSCAGDPCVMTGMKWSVAADVTLVDRDYDGLIDRLYAADTGGNIWRVDLQPDGTGAVSTWQATLFAALGGTGTTPRKFLSAPDVVPTRTYDVVVGITGDREHPLVGNGANSIVNRFYMIKDTKVGNSATGWRAVRDDTASNADNDPASATVPVPVRVTATAPFDGTGPGFFVTLPGAGEKGVNSPTTVGGIVYFGTNRPITTTASCSANLGEARAYAVNFLTGETTSTRLDGGGLPPSPVFGIVEVSVVGADGNTKQRQLPFLIGGGGGSGGDGKSGLGAQKPDIKLQAPRRRTYWYREVDR